MNTNTLRDALAWIDHEQRAGFDTLIPKRQDILNAKPTRPHGTGLHEYRDAAIEIKQLAKRIKETSR